MGTIVSITVYETDEISFQKIKKTIGKAFHLIDKYQKEIFDVNNKNSEISKINRRLSGAEGQQYIDFKVSDDLYRVLEISLDVARKTDFAFDISFKSAELIWLNALKNSRLPNRKK